MEIKIIKGRKKEGDKVLLAKTNGFEAVKMIDVGIMVATWYHNEENLYPPPKFKGGKMFMEFLNDCIKEPNNIPEVAKRYKIPLDGCCCKVCY